MPLCLCTVVLMVLLMIVLMVLLMVLLVVVPMVVLVVLSAYYETIGTLPAHRPITIVIMHLAHILDYASIPAQLLSFI